MTLTSKQAETIATLLNERNALTVAYNSQTILANADNYCCVLSGIGDVIACVEIKRVQWYQCEILHLTVAKDHERKGHAKSLLCEAERVARSRSARILQCTIRDDNEVSRALFEGSGFQRVTTFFNEMSGNNIGVFEKVLIPAR